MEVMLPLRFMAAVHTIVLRGDAPALEPFYPSVGGGAVRGDEWPAFAATLGDHLAEVRKLSGAPVQTNLRLLPDGLGPHPPQLGIAINRKRVLRVMRQHRLIQRRRFQPRRHRPGFFRVSRPAELWHMDMTAIWVAEHGWCYLNAIIDCCTREIAYRRGGYRDPESQAFIESWFSKLKERCVWRHEFETLDQVRVSCAPGCAPANRERGSLHGK